MPVAMDAGPSIRNPRNAYSPNAEAHPYRKSAPLTRLSNAEQSESVDESYLPQMFRFVSFSWAACIRRPKGLQVWAVSAP